MCLRIGAEVQIQRKLILTISHHQRDGPQHIQLLTAAPMKEPASGCWSFISTNSREQDCVLMNTWLHRQMEIKQLHTLRKKLPRLEEGQLANQRQGR